ncbi:hypothetical protein CPB83DRAFT_844795 [Crepidotus variabilis]|uniref:PARP catalytic domain-containing protein n=1 Tax=Crepidotus variabilis TaxID=179855 RepID=A0A9P6ERX5_9AGAR|nr:hypothetical protein CPB83DRAFT_844795 [Crepidotus variabilis]
MFSNSYKISFKGARVPVVIELCEVCHARPKFQDPTGFKHQYCGKTCARNDPYKSPTANRGYLAPQQGVPSRGTAFVAKAQSRPIVHAQQTDKCELCSVQPGTRGTICFSCDQLVKIGPQLQELNPGSQDFKTVQADFICKWKSAGSHPQLEKVYAVLPLQDPQTKFLRYRASKPNSQVARSYYASQCICDFGAQVSLLCNIKACGICSIVKSSFQSFAFGARFNSGRYGDGVYSYSNPAMADRFATTSESSPYRVAIACDVCVELGQKGIDKLGKGESIFVPHSDGILPVFILLYRR